MLARAPGQFMARPVLVIRRRPWRRVVPAVRGLARLGLREWEIARRLSISRRYVRRALSAGGGVWSPEEWARLVAAQQREMGR
ncbi:hypothetical protein [Ancylobacter mangrovi]|uniref:hypothetical protein n=1 Tax=Ancylobacter mangrovi TaxID=2972472 RepID=UPI002161EF52|nr:hypothetical protein [Ancylobacter mangrovi]